MLADSCEAALRSLENATYEEALALVNRMLRARWQDNQLVCSGLSREDLRVIAEVFVTVWQQFNHKRIAYPKAALNVPDRPAAEPRCRHRHHPRRSRRRQAAGRLEPVVRAQL